jgi:ABC-2 type transport system permease protein
MTTTHDTTATSTRADGRVDAGARTAAGTPVGPALTLRRTVRSELVKLRTLRSSVWLLLVAAVLTLTLGPIQTVGSVVSGAAAGGAVGSGADAVSLALTGVATSSLLLGVLGVLVVTGEYAPRAIRTTFMLVPRRGYVVAAKLVVLAFAIAATSAVAVAAAATASFAILARADVHVGWGSPGVLRISLAMVWYLAGWGVLGQAAGWLTRSKIGGAALLMGVMLLLAPALGLVPGRVGETVVALMPSSAGSAMIGSEHATALGSPAAGFLLWTGYLVLFAVVSALAVNRRDA